MFTSRRSLRTVLVAAAVAMSVAAVALVDVIVAGGRHAWNLVAGFALKTVAALPAPERAPEPQVLHRVKAKAYMARQVKRDRPEIHSIFRLCPSC